MLQRGLLYSLLVCVLIGVSGCAAKKISDSIDLSGQWRMALDKENVGQEQRWFANGLSDTVKLPGTLDQNHKGEPNENHNYVDGLSRPIQYSGAAWYQRQIVVPQSWADKRITLSMERTKLTSVWVDEQFAGNENSFGCPQVYDLSKLATPGKHTLTVRVDNKTKPGINGGHQLWDVASTNWNGIIGKIELHASDRLWIENVLVYPNVEEKKIHVKITIGNQTGHDAEGKIVLSSHNVDKKIITFKNATDGTVIEAEYALGKDALLWDEFSPNLYKLNVGLESGTLRDSKRVCFGLREFKAKGTQFCINGNITFLRGKHDAMVNPILGHPSMEVKDWGQIFKIAKSYGINHYRFHTCVPPEAAFEAADLLGVYLQPELYNGGGTFGDKPEGVEYCRQEGIRVLKAYGNHPSFVMFSVGNELTGESKMRADLVRTFREFDPSRLYTQASNYDYRDPKLAQGDDYWTTMRTRNGAEGAVRGSFAHANLPLGHIQAMPPSTGYDYVGAIKDVPVPVIGHETGQFQVYPNFDEIKKYTGVQKAWNFEVFADRLKKAGMYDQWKEFFRASGALAVICYREDIEAALRTPGFGGFQLLDLQDYPGQDTALVGILDAFMDSKGLIKPEQWRRFCCETVPLLRFEKYTWTTNETFTAKLLVAHYGKNDLADMQVFWRLDDSKGKQVQDGVVEASLIKRGALDTLGHIEIKLAELKSPQKYTITVGLKGTVYQNEYPLWIYPEKVNTTPSKGIVIERKWSKQIVERLEKGEKVLLMPEPNEMLNSVEGFFAGDFWCYPMFRKICEKKGTKVAPGTLGILCDPGHPALAQFPTEFHSDWQWWNLVMNSRCMVLDKTPSGYRPIVQVIDNVERNHKLGILFECKVGNGKLLVCTMDLLNHQDKPEVRQLLFSLLSYMDSGKFDPQTALGPETIGQLFQK